jgi:aldose 1-epimerase
MVISLQAGEARATVVPAMGGGIGTLDWRGMPVLRPWSGREADGPFALGMNLLVPFSNRISGGFDWKGRRHEVGPNLAGEAFAIHGDGFQTAWTVERAGAADAVLAVAGAIGPWLYDGLVSHVLSPRSYECRLEMVNRGDAAMPFGGGFHPWFPRHEGTLLQFAAEGYWPEDGRHLPATQRPVAPPADRDWRDPAPLPDEWINAGFSGWDGGATIRQPGMVVSVLAGGCDTTIIYSPDAGSGFFCFEPVSHPVDALNLPGQPGVVGLEPGEGLTLTMSLTWDEA